MSAPLWAGEGPLAAIGPDDAPLPDAAFRGLGLTGTLGGAHAAFLREAFAEDGPPGPGGMERALVAVDAAMDGPGGPPRDVRQAARSWLQVVWVYSGSVRPAPRRAEADGRSEPGFDGLPGAS